MTPSTASNERENRLRRLWDGCEGHTWELAGAVVDTAFPVSLYLCGRCGAATHDPQTGEYCFIRHFWQGPVPGEKADDPEGQSRWLWLREFYLNYWHARTFHRSVRKSLAYARKHTPAKRLEQ